MSNVPIPTTAQEEWLLAKYLINKVTSKASGDADQECHLNYPRDVYFIGNLRPKNDDDISLSHRDLIQKLSPSAFGAEFKVDNASLPLALQIELRWDCYYRLFPTYKQQKSWTSQEPLTGEGGTDKDEALKETNEDETDTDETLTASRPDRQNERRPREDVFIRFRKINASAKGKIQIRKNSTDGYEVNDTELKTSISSELERIYQLINADPERMRLRVAGQQFTIPQEALDSNNAYETFLQGLTIPTNNRWQWEILTNIYPGEEGKSEAVIFFQFVNASPLNEADKTIETFLFNPNAVFDFPENIILPFELELAPKSFRYDRLLWGKGFNCGVKTMESGNKYTTTNNPDYVQMRYLTGTEPKAKFEDLENDPVIILRGILKAMEESKKEWTEQCKNYSLMFGDLWSTNYKKEYEQDLRKFESEIERFKTGISIVESDPDINLSFKLTNEVFKRAGLDKHGRVKKDGWRLFQIVFIVSQIPGMAALKKGYEKYLSDREIVDIIYFPTGGGKTEAYLGTLVFHCFFDRLRGKSAGVTSWIRFPLRLLTIQQTQRLADVIGIADLVRAEQADTRLNNREVHRFSVGYYVGAEGTPNEIKKPFNGNPETTWSSANDEKERQNWKRVVSCPSCKTNSVTVEFNEARVQIIHKCSNEHCGFPNGIIPVYVIDNEIYRYLPSVMVGTIDKLASIGNQRKLSMIFGRVDGYCKDHGFFNDNCCQKECTDKNKLVYKIPQGISGPTLFLQDELHLLREGLGTFDSHYETFAQTLLKEFGNETPLKIIASSATIEKYERQVEHLYGKLPTKARVFPGYGPTLQQSFYASTQNYPQRIFVGILPHNKTIFNAVLELLEYYHRIIQDLCKLPMNSPNPYGGKVIPGTSNWFKLLDLYYSSLSYFLSSRELDSLRTDIEAHINNSKFKNEGYNPVNIKELTGGTSTDDVTKILELLEKEHSPTEPHEAVLATNMVSHGVDIDRFNSMFFYGIPRQNAEYIQASSRVGRTHIGIIFNCFHPIRERDQSHYAYFTKYHEFLGQLVEPVAINRWSAYGIDKTLPGLFMGVLLQVMSNKTTTMNRNFFYILNKVSQLYTDGQIDKNEFKDILKTSYAAELGADPRNDAFNKKIDRAVDIFFDNIVAPNNNNTFVSDALYPPPMRSLRDVDEPITIELDSLGTQWGNKN
jgi:hypothetical protein